MMYNFRSYLLDMKVWEQLHFKNKKAFKTALAVMYGKKKDRSGLKKKITQIRKEYEEESRLISDAIHKVVPAFGRLMDMYGSYGGYGY